MFKNTHYRIDYLMNGHYKSFYIRSEHMDSTEAWHWAAVDAGYGHIPKSRTDRVPKTSKPQAERLGISGVQWASA